MIGGCASPNENKALGGVSRVMAGAAWMEVLSAEKAARPRVARWMVFFMWLWMEWVVSGESIGCSGRKGDVAQRSHHAPRDGPPRRHAGPDDYFGPPTFACVIGRWMLDVERWTFAMFAPPPLTRAKSSSRSTFK